MPSDERETGPIGHMLMEVGAGNPGATHLLSELAEAKRRLRGYEGMMTRREVLEKLAQTHRAMSMAQSTSQVWWNGYMTGLAISAGIKGRLPEQVHDAAHELALMDAEREEEA